MGSSETVGTSCATLHEGSAYLERWQQEQELLRELEDHIMYHILLVDVMFIWVKYANG